MDAARVKGPAKRCMMWLHDMLNDGEGKSQQTISAGCCLKERTPTPHTETGETAMRRIPVQPCLPMQHR